MNSFTRNIEKTKSVICMKPRKKNENKTDMY